MGDKMEIDEKIAFEISGSDYINLTKFREQHKNCLHGAAGDQFSYTFIPTGLGMAITVRCSCGQELLLGDFMDNESGEYDEYKTRVLTQEDEKNKRFEEAALYILNMKSPRLFRIGFQTDQSFELIYSISTYGIAGLSDERISRCILWKYTIGENGEQVDNYDNLDEKEKIKAFYDYFEEHLKNEINKYDCDNKRLVNCLGI